MIWNVRPVPLPGADARVKVPASVTVAEPSVLETLTGPTWPYRRLTMMWLPETPVVVAEQTGSEALICAAMLAAIWAAVSVPSATDRRWIRW